MSDDKYNDLQKFADITIERWMKRMDALGIYETGELKKSFDAQVRLDANGNPELVQFTYMYYGIFPDLGVGTGVTMEQAPSGNRKIKAWYNKTLWRRLNWLAEFMAEEYGREAAEKIKYIMNKDDEGWKTSTYNPKAKNKV